MKYKMYYEDDYDNIERVMADIKDRSFQEWEGYDREGEFENITLHCDGGDKTEPNNWRLTFGNARERTFAGRADYTRRVPYWGYYIFFFENGEQVLIETQSENILEELKDFLNKYTCPPEVILNDDDSFVV